MAKYKTLPIELLFHCFNYDKDTGEFIWNTPKSNNTKKGSIAGSLDKDGYIILKINRKQYKAHRVAWAMHYGEWPDKIIDHINKDKKDNRIENLRLATDSQSRQNQKIRSDSIAQSRCVYYSVHFRKWVAYTSHLGKRKHIGYFLTKSAAENAYRKTAKQIHGEFFSAG